MKIIQLSDLHLVGKDGVSLYGIDPNYRLYKAFKSINKHHRDAEFVVITGDLTDSASPDAYEVLSQSIEKCTMPVYLILGNHDKRDIFKKSFQDFIGFDFIQYVKEVDNTAHIFLDTLVEDCSYGELCSSRMSWLKEKLEKYQDNFIYMYMHHHPVDSGLYEMDNEANFKSNKEFWELLKGYKNIKSITFGHLHRIMHTVKNGISLHSTKSTTFQVAYKPESKVEYLTNDEKPTYAVIDVDRDGNTRVHHHEFLDEDRFYLGDY